jgi:hypothetical protein
MKITTTMKLIFAGPMVWYQMFEYAIGHWMQKATEHVLGCVLCSPGCFSLFRGSALMDDNVMKMYTIMPTEPGHYLQYDQGDTLLYGIFLSLIIISHYRKVPWPTYYILDTTSSTTKVTLYFMAFFLSLISHIIL